MVIANRPDEAKPGSSGQIIPGYEARIVDDQGNAVANSEIGDLLIKGDSTCSGYWNKHEKTKETFVGDWFRTGDKYFQDKEEYFWYAGRSNDVFKVHGLWLSPAEVESVLIAHPAVREAAVVARKDQDGLTKAAAYVVLNGEFTPSELLVQELQDRVGQKSAVTSGLVGLSFYPRFPRRLRENYNASSSVSCKISRAKIFHSGQKCWPDNFWEETFTNRRGSYRQPNPRTPPCMRSALEQQIAGDKAATRAIRQVPRRRRLFQGLHASNLAQRCHDR